MGGRRVPAQDAFFPPLALAVQVRDMAWAQSELKTASVEDLMFQVTNHALDTATVSYPGQPSVQYHSSGWIFFAAGGPLQGRGGDACQALLSWVLHGLLPPASWCLLGRGHQAVCKLLLIGDAG
jgi:hypothetical protein